LLTIITATIQKLCYAFVHRKLTTFQVLTTSTNVYDNCNSINQVYIVHVMHISLKTNEKHSLHDTALNKNINYVQESCLENSDETVSSRSLHLHSLFSTRMWANAQRDDRPAEHRWRPLFNAAKFG